jgi:SAM-dependent methyltransferase
LISTTCAICGTSGNVIELYTSNVDEEAFNPIIFSARRLPDRLHYRIVQCNACGLVRSDPVAAPEQLAQLYAQSSFDYSSEVDGIVKTYGRTLRELRLPKSRKRSLLEIGCGNGFFLQEALAQGYRDVRGVEPSSDAVARADITVRDRIVCDIMHPGLFEPDSFDVICMFQVFDHISHPGALLDECYRLLKPDGLVLCINHNIEAFSARVLKERSPIIDVEHTFLYSPTTMRKLFAQHSFAVYAVNSTRNTYSLRYLVRLSPLPSGIKRRAISLFDRFPASRLSLSVPLGNLSLIAGKAQLR